MRVTGIVAEFNPFHTGHTYLLNQIEGLKVVAMSGNFVQRGEPAICDKWTRAKMAVRQGADLIVELPFGVAVQSADYFAKGAIRILLDLGIDSLAFGCEEVVDYAGIAKIYRDRHKEMTTYLGSLPASLAYPIKAQEMWRAYTGLDLSHTKPNQTLALAYIKALGEKPLDLFPIQRQGSGYHDENLATDFASASAIRRARNLEEVTHFLPEADLFSGAARVSWDNYWDYLIYQIRTTPDLTVFYQVNQEIAARLTEALPKATSADDLAEMVATKRYTTSRIKRILCYILVGIREEPVSLESIHILGFSKKGQHYLKTIKHSVPLVSKIASIPWDRITQQADAVYQMGHKTIGEQTLGRYPVQVE